MKTPRQITKCMKGNSIYSYRFTNHGLCTQTLGLVNRFGNLEYCFEVNFLHKLLG